MSPEPELKTVGPFRVAGFQTRTSNDDPSSIGVLWKKFGERSGELGVQAAPYGVYHNYESDHSAPYSLLVGLPVAEDAVLPDGWEAIAVPRDRYLVFPVPDGPMPATLVQTWKRVWTYFDGSGPYERAYTFDFEQHGVRTEIFIAVRGRR